MNPPPKTYARHPRYWLSGVLLALFFTAATHLSTAATPTEQIVFNEAEKWVALMTKAGLVANLSERFPEEKDRQLSSRFVEDLLTGALPGVKPHRKGVRVRGAVIDGPLDLSNAQIPCEVALESCTFADVTFMRAQFASAASFNDSTFQAANFNSAKIGDSLFFRGAVFEGPANFGFVDVGRNFEAQRSQFRNRRGEADFYSMKVRNSILFNSVVFEGPVVFGGTEVGGLLVMTAAEFRDAGKGANFYAMKIGQSAFLSQAVFEGPVGFGGTVIGNNLEAQSAQFRSQEKEANFNSMKVEHSAFFNTALFAGPVNFGSLSIASDFAVTAAHFRNKEQLASFNSMKIGHTVFFSNALFEGPVDVGNTDIAGSLEAFETNFQNAEKEVSFNSTRVEHAAFFSKAIFEGPVNFVGADIGSNFEAEEAQFRSKTQPKLIMKCGRKGIFTGAIFAGEVNLADSSFLDLLISSGNPNGSPVPKLDLSRISIRRQLKVENIKIQDLVAASMRVEGSAVFTNVIVIHSADLRNGDVTNLELSKCLWPKDGVNAGIFRLEGLTYKDIRTGSSDPKSHDELLKLAHQSAFSPEVYGNLEAFFLRQGDSARADQAFIEGKRRERKESFHGIRQFNSLLLDWLVGYGRQPRNAGIPCLFFIILGWLFFSCKKMELQDKKDEPRVYGRSDRFWYSVGLFLPFVDLQADKLWRPKPEYTFLRNYARVHILFGWILIPILLAALTGLIK